MADRFGQDEQRKDGEKPRAIAVALSYDASVAGTPRVVASGRGFLAEQILELAFANGVKVREDADLAQLLAAVDVDSEIPVEAYAAVAEVLVYLYRANNNMAELIGDAP
ncbi:MAG: EscU/YscU/HrcU family type III secretion system export apparatus switch protein [Alphaproteobacteria bacterium]|nr:EscU/YscU/HrcU family type III secretion system export apparatus switch protein [Alphaproteobacteria bacterium]MBF0129546.1 EscU/YscU/HrcU family type III secretion system export apparatus switch protein [Alphaproteobacteria bacterium]